MIQPSGQRTWPEIDARAVLDASVELLRGALAAESVREVADVGIRLLADLVRADQGSLGLLDGRDVVTTAVLIRQPPPVGSRFPLGFGVAGWVAAVGSAAEIADVRQDRRYVALPYPEVRSFLGLPLAMDGTVVGVASLAAWTPEAFPDGTAATLQPLTEQLARLLHKADADQRLRERLRVLEEDVNGALTEGLHELKAPLAALAGLVDVVASEQAGPLAAPQRDLLKLAQTESERLRRAVTGLVETASYTDRPAQPRELVDPFDLLVQTAERFGGLAQGQDVSLQVNGAPRAARTPVDGEAILRVLANLVQNALEVSPHGGSIRLGLTVEPGMAWLSVEDEGSGIPDADRARVLERYEQGDGPELTRDQAHVGLGLWLSRRVVMAHGGTMLVESASSGGARLRLSLPTTTA